MPNLRQLTCSLCFFEITKLNLFRRWTVYVGRFRIVVPNTIIFAGAGIKRFLFVHYRSDCILAINFCTIMRKYNMIRLFVCWFLFQIKMEGWHLLKTPLLLAWFGIGGVCVFLITFQCSATNWKKKVNELFVLLIINQNYSLYICPSLFPNIELDNYVFYHI
jgi:hypothetical protein